MQRLEEILDKDEFNTIIRLSSVEMDSMLLGKITNELKTNAGFYGDKLIYNEWYNRYLDAIKKADYNMIVKAWFTRYLHKKIKPFLKRNNLITDNIIEYPKDIRVYLNYIKKNKDKNILIVFPFEDTYNYNKDNIVKALPEYYNNVDNITILKSYQTISGNKPHNNWLETYNILCDKIDNVNFDICLLSCGCYGLPLINHIQNKHSDKKAIYIGGRLQLCLGILGGRWDDENINKDLYNKYWIRPLISDQPKNFKNVENGCYW